MYDPGWDMPKANWVQQGSYEPGEIPPIYAPDEGPLVCLPPINQYWLPFVLGCLDQLRQPTTWITADDDALATALFSANRLMQMFGERADCPVPYELRVSGCNLQYSTDGGDTFTTVSGWSDFLTGCIPPQTLLSYDDGCILSESLDGGTTYEDVPGWVENFGGCVQKYTLIIGIPPNPQDKTADQLACAIAAYLAEQVVIAAMGKAVTAIQDDLTLLQFGLDVVNIIPEFVLVTLAADAFAGIYAAVQEGILSDYEDALTDTSLLADITCAIYGCIVGDGYVTPGNFDCITASISMIPYVHSDVITAIGSYLSALGAVGLAQLSQVAGLHAGEDCSGCGGWCLFVDFAGNDQGWVPEPTDPGAFYDPIGGHWSAGESGGGQFVLDIHEAHIAGSISTVRLKGNIGTAPMAANVPVPYNKSDSSDNVPFVGTLPPGPYDITLHIGRTWNGLGFFGDTVTDTGTGFTLTSVEVRGTGTPPDGGEWTSCPD